MRIWYVSNRETNDNRIKFYCGITNDPETRKDTHEREDHDGREVEKMLVYECDSVEIATDTESIMGKKDLILEAHVIPLMAQLMIASMFIYIESHKETKYKV